MIPPTPRKTLLPLTRELIRNQPASKHERYPQTMAEIDQLVHQGSGSTENLVQGSSPHRKSLDQRERSLAKESVLVVSGMRLV